MIITHQMSVVREICTHVAIMYEGEVVEKGLVADIFANPQSEVAKELIRKDTGSDIDADSRLDVRSGKKDRQRSKAVRRYESYSPRIQLLSL